MVRKRRKSKKVTCPSCGREVHRAKFCGACGKEIPKEIEKKGIKMFRLTPKLVDEWNALIEEFGYRRREKYAFELAMNLLRKRLESKRERPQHEETEATRQL